MDMDGFVINPLLQEIIDQVAYEQGYEKITGKVFSDDIDYETTIAAAQRIIDENISYN